MQGLRCVEMFLTKPVVEFRSIFENVVKIYQINTKIVGQIVRLLIKCRVISKVIYGREHCSMGTILRR